MKRFETLGTIETPVFQNINKVYYGSGFGIEITAKFEEFSDTMQKKLTEINGKRFNSQDIFDITLANIDDEIGADRRAIAISTYDNIDSLITIYPLSNKHATSKNKMIIDVATFDMIVDYMKQACNDNSENLLTLEDYDEYITFCNEELAQ